MNFPFLTLITGEEALLNIESLATMRQNALKAGFTGFERWYRDDLNWDDILIKMQSGGLFAEKRFIEIHFPDETKLDKKSQEALKQIHINDDNALLIYAPNLEKPEQTSWFKTIEINLINNKKLYPRDFNQQLYIRLKKHNLQLTPLALELLQQCCDNNLLSAHQFIQQLTFFNTSNINEDLIKKVLEDNSQYNSFTLMDALINNDFKKALSISCRLNESLSTSEKIKFQIGLTFQLQRDATLLLKLQQINTNEDFIELFKQYNIPNFKQKQYHQAKQLFSSLQLNNLLRLSAKLDRMNKGNENGNFWLTLINYLLSRIRNASS